MPQEFRQENDLLGRRELPADALYGIHTVRSLENFPLAGRTVFPELIHAYGTVKMACALTNRELGCWSGDKDNTDKADAVIRACEEMARGELDEHIKVDLLQGGAGTSTNMNVNEVLANRALLILDDKPGNYQRVSPLDDINLHQSTNDTYPTALKLALIRQLDDLEQQLVALQEAFQAKEKEFADVVKVGRTQMQDAVLITLGREMSAYAEAFNRDRWRVYKCQERLRVINLGGTAIGTGLAAPRQYIFAVVEKLRELTGIGFARSENLVDATQNADVFVEVSGILKACAASLIKVCNDLRFMSSGPQAGLGEITLPQMQTGSSVMPGKVNPVIPEAVIQAAMMTMGYDVTVAQACAAGSLELNPFLPLVAACLLDSCRLLTNACSILNRSCVAGINADRDRCRQHTDSSTAVATALVGKLGYEKVCDCIEQARKSGRTVREIVVSSGLVSDSEFEEMISPEAVCRLGSPDVQIRIENQNHDQSRNRKPESKKAQE